MRFRKVRFRSGELKLRRSRYSLGVVLAALAISSILNLTAHSQAFGKNNNRDGREPFAGLIMDNKGNLYGTTLEGGAYLAGTIFGAGTVFELTPPTTSGGSWTESILHSFNGTDGSAPDAGLVMDTDTNGNLLHLYGTTLGLVFKLTPPSTSGGKWTESVLSSLNGTNARLLMDKVGNLYGGTQGGGVNGDGTVFELSPPAKKGSWTKSILHSFDGSDGSWVIDTSIIMDASGNLYGTAYHGGTQGAPPGNGTVFELTPPATKGGGWTELPPYSFNGGTTDGQNPTGLTLSNGNLFGATVAGGAQNSGTVFELTPNGGPESILWSFGSGTDGKAPHRSPIADANGNLYGTTQLGGNSNDGTVFELSPPTSASGTWTESILHSFSGTDGDEPVADLIMVNGNLYGTTTGGGTDGLGTVFELTPPSASGGSWTESVLYSFNI